MASMKVYDPKAVTLIFGAIIVQGYADGTFIEAEPNNDAFTLQVGADGDAARSKSNDRSGRVTFTIMHTSDTNDLLSAMHALDLGSSNGDGIAPVLIKDLNGRTLIHGQKAWIVKHPSGEFGKEVGTRSWVLESDNLVLFHGGN